MAAPFLRGHHGYHGAIYMLRAACALRFHRLIPVNWAGSDPPPPNAAYLHVPIGYAHALDLPLFLFGKHEWVARATAAAGGAVLLVVLYRFVRRHWSPEAGLLAVAAFVGLPFVTEYSVLVDPMFPAMALSLVIADRWLRHLDSPARRHVLVAATACAASALLMWDVLFQAAFHSIEAIARARKTRWRRDLAWVVATGAGCAVPLLFHAALIEHANLWRDVGESMRLRTSAGDTGNIWRWMELLLGSPAIVVGAMWLLWFIYRISRGRARPSDRAVLFPLATKTAYILLFRANVSVHEYRIDWYALYVVLALADLATDLATLIRARFSSRNTATALIGLAVLGWFSLETPLAVRRLLDSRVHMGTDGHADWDVEYPKQLFAMEVERRTRPDDFVFVHRNLRARMEFFYYVDRPNIEIPSLVEPATLSALSSDTRPSVLLLDAAQITEEERPAMLKLLRDHPATLIDHFLFVDLRQSGSNLRALRLEPRPASRAYRFFVSHVYPPMRLADTTTAFGPGGG